MRAFIVLSVLVLGCTKPNPNRCCTDDADCTTKGIPVGSQCESGLLCRGNQCIAQPCTASSECDLTAPYCVDELCGASCNDDAQCPAFGQADVPYCVDGACVACRSSVDCPEAAAAVCESGSCRACRAHDECDSNLCDVDTGTCIAESVIAYAAPGGSTTSACTKSDPCTASRAVSVLDATRTAVKLAPGTYAEDVSRRELATFGVAIYGPATIMGLVTLRGAIKSRLRDLTIVGSAEFGDGNLSLPMGSVDAARIDLTIPEPFDGMRLSHCDGRFREMRIQTHHFAEAAFVAGNGGSLDVERVEIDAYPQPQGALKYTTCFNLAAGTTATIRNSVLRECLGSGGRGAIVSSESGAIDVSFSTFYNSFLACGDGNLTITSRNNIILNERTDGPADSVTGSRCRNEYSLIKPQVAMPYGVNNILNQDPRLLNPAAGDFHLAVGSPAIDTADPAATEAVDFEGTTRPQGAGRDKGAFEYKP